MTQRWMNEWNSLAPQARSLGLPTEDYTSANWNWSDTEGRERVARLQRLILSRSSEEEAVVGTRSPELMSVAEMWEEWNRFVPRARRLGCSRRVVSTPICWRASRQEAARRLGWIRAFVTNPVRSQRGGPSRFPVGPVAVPPGAIPASSIYENAIRTMAVETTSMTPVGERTFGVELEFLMPEGMTSEQLARRIEAAGVPCYSEMYNHRTGSNWKIVTDGSLGDYTRGRELVSPVLTASGGGYEAIENACRVLVEVGCKPTKKCGFHVHVGARGTGVGFLKNLTRAYRKWEPTIDGLMSPSRRGFVNDFCRPVHFVETSLEAATTMDAVMRACGHDVGIHSVRSAGRYKKLNLQSMYQHGTVEFRQHAGTVDGQKVAMWVRFCVKMVEAAMRGPVEGTPDLSGMMIAVGASSEEEAYFRGRATRFGVLRLAGERMAAAA